MKHKNELQKYSVYDITVNRATPTTANSVIGGGMNGKPGLLQQIVYTPENQLQNIDTYIYGINNIKLNYNGQSIWRIPSQQQGGSTSQTIIFTTTTNPNKAQYTLFTYTGILQLTLFSQRIMISRQDSSWYTWNQNKTKCLITHNLDGYIDFITRYQGKQQIYVSNTVIDNNTLELNFGNFFNGNLVQLLKYFKVTQQNQIMLSLLIDFSLYNFTENTIIGIYRNSDNNDDQQSNNIEGIEANSILQISGLVEDIKNYSFTYNPNQYYKIYAITPEEYRKDYIQLVVWKLDQSKDRLKENVFTYQKYAASSCIWQRYDNDQGYDLQIPYRFTFLGYTKKHNLSLRKTDSTGQIFLQKDYSWADTKTVTTIYEITKQFTYGLENKTMKVLTPNLNEAAECEFILIYSSCWAESYFCNLMDPNVGSGRWSTRKNMYNQQVQVLTLKHKLNGIVKIHIRDIRQDLYDTYILDNQTIQIVFMKHYKYNKYQFFVDLYTIWKEDN